MDEHRLTSDHRVKFVTVQPPGENEWNGPMAWAAVLGLMLVIWTGNGPSNPKITVILIALTVPGVWYLIAKWRGWLRQARATADETFPETETVVCYLYPEHEKGLAEIHDRVFEPIAMRWWSFLSPRWILDRPKHGMAIYFAGVIVPVLLSCSTGHRFIGVAIVAALAAPNILPMLIRPRYIRISPGRVEELRAWFWRVDVVRTRDYDLTHARIVIRLDRGYIAIENPDSTVVLNAFGLREPFAKTCALIVRAKLAARHAYPNLPATSLLG